MSNAAALPHLERLRTQLEEHHAWLLIALTLLLFCTDTLFNAPIWIMGLAGLYLCARRPATMYRDRAVGLLGLLFLCIWVPQLLSLPDAANAGRAMNTALPYPHFYFAGVFMVTWMREPATRRRVETALFLIVSLWCLDGLIQFLAGADLFGYPYRKGQLAGMFHPEARLGHMLAVVVPVYLDYIRRAAPGRPWMWLFAVLLFVILLLTGKRAAWIMAAVATAGYLLYLCFGIRRVRPRSLALAAIGIVAVLGSLAAFHGPTARRVEVTMGLFSGNLKAADRATAHRFPLWDTAWDMARANWINGVGPRGFRYVYEDYAGPNDFYLRGGRDGSTHPHQLVLEVAAETGAIGLLGLALFWWLLLRMAQARWRSCPESVPWLLAALAAWLPLNAHMAFYGSYWSSVLWWALPLAVAAAHPAERQS